MGSINTQKNTLIIALLLITLVSACTKRTDDVLTEQNKIVENKVVEDSLDEKTESLINNITNSQMYQFELEYAREYLDQGANPNARFSYLLGDRLSGSRFNEFTPLAAACYLKYLEMISLLIEYGADVNAHVDQSGDTPLTLLLVDSSDKKELTVECLKVLLDAKADPNITKFREGDSIMADGLSPLQLAVASENLEATTILLEYGADPNYKNSENGNNGVAVGLTAIFTAVQLTNSNILLKLIEYGADPNVHLSDNMKTISSTGRYPIHDSVTLNMIQNTKILLEAGADPNISEAGDKSNRFTPLTIGVKNPQITALLLAFGADPNKPRSDGSGVTPLITNASMGYTETVELLIENGADINHISQYGTAMDVAIQYDRKEITSLLSSYEAKTSEELEQ